MDELVKKTSWQDNMLDTGVLGLKIDGHRPQARVTVADKKFWSVNVVLGCVHFGANWCLFQGKRCELDRLRRPSFFEDWNDA